jgi:uncharacterized protein
MQPRDSLIALVALTALVLPAGCSSSPASRFYVLSPTAEVGSAVDAAVGIGPVELPPYLDRDSVVTRDGPTTLSLAEFDRWAEPLQDGFERCLAEDVSAALGTSRIVVHPWGPAPIDVRVPVQVVRFDSDASGTATLVAKWSVLHADQSVALPARHSTATVPAASSSFADTALALSQAVAALAQEIAAAVRGLREWTTTTGADAD